MTEFVGYGTLSGRAVEARSSSHRRDESGAAPGLLDYSPPTEGLRNVLSTSSNSTERAGESSKIHAASLANCDAAGESESSAKRQGRESTTMTTESTSLLSTAHGGAKRAHSCEDSFSSSSESDGGFAGGEKGAWKGEAKIISKSAAPLTLAFLLQSSLQFTSTICVGHIGTTELGAVALGAMTATITGYSVFIGLATSLDTLCAQAYGSGNHSLLGLHVQRMILLLFTVAIPIACVWLSGTHILLSLLPHEQTEIAHLAGRYLKIVILGLPGYALFESGKRYVQAQGNFKGTMFVLCVVAPINVVLHWLFVWKLEWGFVGCPIAIVIAQSLLPAILLLYVWLCVGPGCWPGYSGKVFTNWGPMVKLAIPGMTMVVAEHLAFEILTVASAQLSQTHLGAQTILMNLVIIAYMLPFPFSIAASTRLAHLIGASEPEAAKVAAKVTYVVGGLIGIFNMLVLSAFRPYIPRAFTTDAAVVALAAQVLPVNAAFQLFDALTAQCNGILRGLGRQKIGGYISILVFYVIAIPVSLGTAFGAGWSLGGLWMGPALALLTQSSSESVYIWFTDWKQACREAADRNMSG